jgi:hypothetical protein
LFSLSPFSFFPKEKGKKESHPRADGKLAESNKSRRVIAGCFAQQALCARSQGRLALFRGSFFSFLGKSEIGDAIDRNRR